MIVLVALEYVGSGRKERGRDDKGNKAVEAAGRFFEFS